MTFQLGFLHPRRYGQVSVVAVPDNAPHAVLAAQGYDPFALVVQACALGRLQVDGERAKAERDIAIYFHVRGFHLQVTRIVFSHEKFQRIAQAVSSLSEGMIGSEKMAVLAEQGN